MTAPVPDAAVQIAAEALCDGGEEQTSRHVLHEDYAERAVAALASEFAFVEHAELAALRAVTDAVGLWAAGRLYDADLPNPRADARLLAALDALDDVLPAELDRRAARLAELESELAATARRAEAAAAQIVVAEVRAINPGFHAHAMAYRVVAALTRAGWLHDPTEDAARRRAEAAEQPVQVLGERHYTPGDLR